MHYMHFLKVSLHGNANEEELFVSVELRLRGIFDYSSHFTVAALELHINRWRNSLARCTLQLITHLWPLSTRIICDYDVCLL